jgi:hypothetical protein
MIYNKNALQGFTLGMLAALIVVSLGIAPVLAYQDDQPPPATDRAPAPQASAPKGFGGPSPLVIPAAAFTSDGTDPDGFFFNFNGYIDGTGSACLKAPVYLPRGVMVYGVYASLYDNYTSDIFVDLRRVDKNSGQGDVMASLSTVSNSTSIQQRKDLTIDYPVIGDLYSTFAYFVTTCLHSADHRLYSVRIYYRYHQVHLPLVLDDFN